jgi:hypothetical protein
VSGDNLTGQVWVGGGLVRHMPMSPERAEQQRREDEREAQQAAFEAQQREEAAIERRWELQRQGYQARSVLETAEAVHAMWDRGDARNERQRAQNQAAAGASSWRSMRAQLAAERSRRTQAEYDRDAAIRSAENAHAARRRAEQQTSYRSSSPQQYTRYTGGAILGGPY